MPKKLQAYAEFQNTWDVPLLQTCIRVPIAFWYSFFCPCCMAYQQRSRLLDGDVANRYICCQGQVCGEVFNKITQPCPRFCLVVEVVWCFWCALGANRSLIQQAYRLQNTWLENCMIWLSCITAWIVCIVSIFVPIPDEIDWILDCLYCAFQACLQSQQERELDMRKPKNGGPGAGSSAV